LATLEVFAPDTGAEQEARDLPFEGISVDSKEGESKAVLINVGRTPTDHVSHKIDHPVHIWLQKTEAAANAALEIEAEDDSKTLLRFRSPNAAGICGWSGFRLSGSGLPRNDSGLLNAMTPLPISAS
jgi:hypothetical protein